MGHLLKDDFYSCLEFERTSVGQATTIFAESWKQGKDIRCNGLDLKCSSKAYALKLGP
jgi:hypothetical protein